MGQEFEVDPATGLRTGAVIPLWAHGPVSIG